MAGIVAGATIAALGWTLLPASSAVTATQRFRVCDQSKPGYEHDVDSDNSGDFSPGDRFLFEDKLLDPQTGRKAGRDVGEATFIRIVNQQDALADISAMFFFPSGKISVYFSARFSDLDKGERFPITGGTGAYENASGSVFIKNHPCDGEPGTSFHFHVQ